MTVGALCSCEKEVYSACWISDNAVALVVRVMTILYVSLADDTYLPYRYQFLAWLQSQTHEVTRT